MGQSSSPKPALLIAMVAVLAVSGGVVWLLLVPGEPQVEPVAASAEPSNARARSSRSRTPTSERKPGVEPVPALAKSAKTEDDKRDSERAQALVARNIERERIWSALRKQHELEPAESGNPVPNPTAIGQLPELDAEYIRTAIKEQLVPIAVDCYNTVLSDEPEAGGRLVLDFTIVGAEDIGGVVEASEINEDSDFESPFLRECLRESMMTVTFDAPPGGGRIEVTYPLVFEAE